MSRIRRAVVENIPHHITQRGNGRQVVFETHEAYRLYVDLLRQYSERYHLALWAYCLMPNHIHLVAVPLRSDSLARTLGRTHADFARYFNLCHRSCGHVWQARFFSCPLSGNHIWNAMAYVESNPVRAGLSSKATVYKWSSATAHVHQDSLGGLLDLAPWRERFDGQSWQELLDARREGAFPDDHQLQEATLRGRPCADPHVIKELERRLGRSLTPGPTGRPKKPLSQADQQTSLRFVSGD